jgi:hypothetical protein
MSLFAIHDAEGAAFPPLDGWVVDTVALSENPAPQDYSAIRPDCSWLVRLNWGYGSTGTIPAPNEVDRFIEAAIVYVIRSRGAHSFIVGNEPNHENERPNGMYITPTHYAQCFNRTRAAVRSARPEIRVVPAAFAPYHANPTPWTAYGREVYKQIEAGGGADGINIHAYTRGMRPEDIQSDRTMGEPIANTYSGFWTYQDALALVPNSMKGLPAYITEFLSQTGKIRIPVWFRQPTRTLKAGTGMQAGRKSTVWHFSAGIPMKTSNGGLKTSQKCKRTFKVLSTMPLWSLWRATTTSFYPKWDNLPAGHLQCNLALLRAL